MKKWIPIIIAAVFLMTGATAQRGVSAAPPKFHDVGAEDWFAPYVLRLSGRGVVSGYEDGSFRPNGSVTWGEALKLVLRSAGFAEQGAAAGAHWASGYLDYARRCGYLPEDAAPNLDEPLTRAALARLCAAALELPEAGTDMESPFADTAEPEALALWEAGLMEGSVTDGLRLFGGGSLLRRGEICAVLSRVQEYVDGHFVFVSGFRAPVDFSLRFHSYEPSDFTLRDGRLACAEGGETPSPRFGVDVSYYQGDIDWQAAKRDGVDFAIIRCGYRGYGSAGRLHEDVKFRQNIEGALAAGLDVGIYFFSQAMSVPEALEEAEYTLSLIEGYDIRFPVVFDWERMNYSDSRTRSPDWDTVSDCALAFCGAVEQAGYRPMVYFNKHMSYLQLDMHKLQQYDGWLAMYQNHLDYIYDFQMWQYSSKGAVGGIAGPVDVNLCFADY